MISNTFPLFLSISVGSTRGSEDSEAMSRNTSCPFCMVLVPRSDSYSHFDHGHEPRCGNTGMSITFVIIVMLYAPSRLHYIY